MNKPGVCHGKKKKWNAKNWTKQQKVRSKAHVILGGIKPVWEMC